MNQVLAPDIPADLVWLDPPASGARSLLDWRGTTVLLHFWTRSCVNCHQAMAELDRVIGPYGDSVEVIGVHAPKFAAERNDDVVRAGMEQLGVDHPVINDADHRLCRLFGLQHWPTVVVVDPNGNLVFEAVGETAVAGLGSVLADLAASRDPSAGGAPARGRVGRPHSRRNQGRMSDDTATAALRSPHRLLALDQGWLVAEQGGDLVRVDEGFKPIRRFVGFGDPAGMCLLPDGRVAVADATNHQVVALDLDRGQRQTLAGSGTRAARRLRAGTAAGAADLASPHDVAWWHGQLVIAVTGLHQIIAVADADPNAPVALIAGSSAEGFKDGTARRARLAMPTALAVDGDRLWFTDADSSSLRLIEADRVRSTVGHAVDTSGHRDGAAHEALMQHPCGISIDPSGRVLIADVFNGALRRYDPASDQVETVAGGLQEPTDVVIGESGVVVVERAGHRVRVVALTPARIRGEQHRFSFPPTLVTPELEIRFAGGGEATIEVAAHPADLVQTISTTASSARVRFSAPDATGHLEVVAVRNHCERWCSLDRLTWSIPVRVDAKEGATLLPLLPR